MSSRRGVGGASVALCVALSVSGPACSSASSSGNGDGMDSGFGGFGDDSGSTDKDSGSGTHKKDAGSSGSKDAGSTAPPGDAACGFSGGNTWCSTNAPMLSSSNNLYCDDFDQGILSTIYNWPGVRADDLVNTRYVSPYCALVASTAIDGGVARGVYTEHPYTLAPASAGATLAFDLYVPSDSSCEGAVVGQFFANAPPNGEPVDGVTVWLTVSGITSAGYSVGMRSYVGDYTPPSVGPGQGSAPAPVTVQVAPRSKDRGWARIQLTLTSYAVAPSGSVSGSVAWSYAGESAVVAKSSTGSATGTLSMIGNDPQISFDVGVIPDPFKGAALTGCQLFVDNVVSNIVTK